MHATNPRSHRLHTLFLLGMLSMSAVSCSTAHSENPDGVKRQMAEPEVEAAMKRDQFATAQFRVQIAPGSISNCGEVLSVSNGVATVRSDKGEISLPVNQLYPDGFGCQFSGDQYKGPVKNPDSPSSYRPRM
jgi:hypothetical protein